MNRREFLTAAGLMGLLVCAGCGKGKNSYLSYEEHPVDQVFRDFRGYRILFTDEQNVVRERRYDDDATYFGFPQRPNDVPETIAAKFSLLSTDFTSQVFVIKDLEEGARGVARVLKSQIYRSDRGSVLQDYAEIHIPKNQKIGPGIDRTGGKFSQDIQMHEIE